MHPAERKQNLQRLQRELKHLREEPVPGVHAAVSLSLPFPWRSSLVRGRCPSRPPPEIEPEQALKRMCMCMCSRCLKTCWSGTFA